MTSRRTPLLALAMLVIASVAGCARDRDDVVTLKFWAMGREGEVVSQLIPDFERRHPGIRIDLQQLPWTAAHEKLLTAFAGDALPDVSQLGNTWIPEMAALDALEPLQPLVDATRGFDAGDFFPGIWDTHVVDDRLLGIPWYVDTRLLFYRTDLLAEAGITAAPRDWNEWRAAMAAIRAHADPKHYAILLPLNEFEPLLNLAIQQPDRLLRDDDTRGNFRSAGFRRAFDFYLEMFRNDWAPPMSDTQIANVWNEFAVGFYAFYMTGPWNIGEFRRRLPESLKDRWSTAALPGPDGPGTAVAGGTGLVVFRSTPHRDAAWTFVRYLTDAEQQRRFHGLTGNLPARRSVWHDPALTGDAQAQAFRVQLERVKAVPKVPEWERIVTAMRLATERVVRGGADVDATLAALDAEVDRILEKRRWIVERKAAPR